MFNVSGKWLRLLCLIVTSAPYVAALEPNQPTSSYMRLNFTVEDGLSANIVNAVVQTRNGILWIGTDVGLDRFNGRNFIPTYFRGKRSTQGMVWALAEAPDGDLWIGTSAGLVRIPAANLDHPDGSPTVTYHFGTGTSDEITSLHVARTGVLWVGTSVGLYRFSETEFIKVLSLQNVSRIEDTSDGHLLVVCAQGFVEWDGTHLIEHPRLARELGIRSSDAIFHVMQDSRGDLWFCTGLGIARRSGHSVHRLQPFGGPSAPSAIRVYEDRQGTVWARMSTGLFRAGPRGLELLTTGATKVVYGDREGNLWIGTNGGGLELFKDRPIRMFTMANGLPSNIPMTVLERRDGSLWVGNNCGGISVLEGQRFKTYREQHGLTNSCVWSLAEDDNNDLWIGTWGGGVFRFAAGRFTQFSKAQGLTAEVVRSIIAARDGSLWMATDAGVLHKMKNGEFRNYTVADGLSSDRILAVFQDRTGVIWAGTSRGIDRWNGKRFTPIETAEEILAPRYVGLGEDAFGELYSFSAPKGLDRLAGNRFVSATRDLDLLNMVAVEQQVWFSGGNGIFRMPAAALRQAGRDADTPLDYAAFGRTDGLISTQCSIGAPNMAITRDGRLWVATVEGLASINLARIPIKPGRPAIFIEEVTVGRTKQSAGTELILAPGTNHVELHFGAIALASPEKIRFQYRLEGVDSVWLEADTHRTAVYTSIPPGTHLFRVRACNSDGIWDRAGIAYQVTQEPHLYETRFFRTATVAAVILLLAFLYRLRMRQITVQMQTRLDERVSERTRVARDLHDTLLQTIQASQMVAESALAHANDSVRMHRALQRLSEWLKQATQEGRAVLSSLRSSTSLTNNLAEDLKRAGSECVAASSVGFAITVEGEPREMHPMLRDDVYRIGYEAIRNASIHSEGTEISVVLSYGRDLVLYVRDNGRGIDPEVLARGRDGHFGLSGMRERASRLRSRLSFRSDSQGTQVELVIPGTLVFPSEKGYGCILLMKLRRLVGLPK